MPESADASHRLPNPIAIDGPAASGKTTVGRALAERLGYRFLDTGMTYRALTLVALRRKVPATDEAACVAIAESMDLRFEPDGSRVALGDEDVTDAVRSPEVEANVSAYSALPRVREVMVRLQRQFTEGGAAVLAGRDIGTVVLPSAPLKFYLEASEEARAKRRSLQAGTWGVQQQVAEAQRDIAGRDRIDASRAASPLMAAPDAIVIDTTDLTLDQLIAMVEEKVRCASS